MENQPSQSEFNAGDSTPSRQFVSQLKSGTTVEDCFAVKFKKPPVAYRTGKPGSWFTVQIADKSGEIPLKYWGKDNNKTEKIFAEIDSGSVVFVKGRVTEYNGSLEISVDAHEGVVEPTTNFNLADLVATSLHEIKDLVDELLGYIEQIRDPFLNQLCNKFFNNPKNLKLFSESPAAMMRHQNYVGGLIEHTLNLISMCIHYAAMRASDMAIQALEGIPSLDKDLLIAGCIFHDIGKIYEFETKTTIDISREGMLLGHIPIGIMMVNDLIKEIPDFPEILRLKILHIILSHHGKLEYGSLKEPQFPEAELIHYVDQVDSKVDYMLRQKEEANTNDPWIWTRERRHVYLE